MRNDILWLGVHKTGTTFLQKSLDQSEKPLKKVGIQYVELDEFRHRWTRPLLHDDHPEAPTPGKLPADMQRWLVFDENILALVQHGLTRQGLYPEGARRAKIVAKHLELEQPRIVLGLRSFAGFIPSIYCEALKSTPFRTFRKFLQQPLEAMSWVPLISHLQATFPDSDVLLYQAEDLPGHEARLLSLVTGIPEQEFTLLRDPERLGFSHKAVSHLHDLAKTGPVKKRDVRAAVADHPRGPAEPGFSPWNTQERIVLDASYEKDITVFRGRSLDSRARLHMLDLARERYTLGKLEHDIR